MPVFFPGPPGRTIALLDPATQGAISTASVDPFLGYSLQRSVITRLTLAHQGNYQFLHTLGNDIYIYVFGDRVGSVTLSGLSMAASCDDSSPAHGGEMLLEWYAENRLAQRQEPVRVTIGVRTVIEGFVTGINQDVVDPSTRIMAFNLSLAVLPGKATP